MKKNIFLFFIFILFIFIYNNTFSNWYGNHGVSYSNPGGTVLSGPGGPNRGTWCDQDGDTNGLPHPTLGERAIASNNSSSTLTPHGTSATSISPSGTIRCLYWDDLEPDGTISSFSGWTNQTIPSHKEVNFTISELSRGGSGLASYQLYVQTSTDAPNFLTWSNIKTVQSVFGSQPNQSNTYPNVTGKVRGPRQTYNYIYNFTGLNNTAYKFMVRITDKAGNSIDYYSTDITKIDLTPPDISDVHSVTNPNLLADTSREIELRIERDGGTSTDGSPISSITRCFENYSTNDNWGTSVEITAYSDTDTDSYFRRDEDIRNVDNDRHPTDGNREYSYKIIKICDEAGNCVSSGTCIGNVGGSKTPSFWNMDYYVYANTISPVTTFTSRDVIIDDISNPNPLSGNIANGTTKNITIELKDEYGNEIVPASGIGRDIDFNFDVNNSLHLDQYTQSGNGVFMNIPNDTTHYSNRLPLTNATTPFDNQTSTDGTYNFGFKIYTPTDGEYMAEPGGDVIINNITFDIDDTIDTAEIGNSAEPQDVAINSGNNIDFNFAPKYEARFAGEIKDYGFIEGSVQNSSISITNNSSFISGLITNSHIYMEFGSGATNESSPDLNMTLSGGTMNPVKEGNQTNITDLVNSLSLANQNIQTLLTQESSASLDSLQHAHLSTHIGYTVSNPALSGGPIYVRYNSDVIGKINYWLGLSSDNTYQSGIKVLGITSSKNTHEIMTNQEDNDIHIVGNLTKASLRKDLKRKVYMIIKNLQPTTNHTIDDLLGDTWDSQYGDNRIYNNKVLYYKTSGNDVELGNGNDLTVEGKKTIIIEGANLYIRNNMFYSDKTKDILGIIVLKDRNGHGGNIYIDPSVTNIVGTLYADKSLISYNGTELDGDTDQSVLKNQLHIYGSVFSENTIGGSRAAPLKCPYYVSSCNTKEEAQKYDLNYLRRYFIYDSDGNGMINGSDEVANGGSSYNGVTNQYRQYPLVIEYNSLLQTSPPPMFSK